MAWYDTAGQCGDVVIASRISLTRDLEGYPFGERLSGGAREELIGRVTSALSGAGLTEVDLSALEPAALKALAEKRLIDPEFAGMELPRTLLLGEERGLSVAVGGRDHVKITALLPGAAAGEAWSSASELVRLLDRSCDFAYSEELGYLTSDITSLGTAAEFSMLIHLPALGERSPMSGLRRCGLEARALPGDLWSISAPPFPGITEEEQSERLTGMTERIAALEREARAELRADPTRLCDRVMRAYGIMSGAYRMTLGELMPLWSSVRLGAVIGLPELPSPEELGGILMSVMPSCLPDDGDPDVLRAARLRVAMRPRRSRRAAAALESPV